jgi:hypothetical protein
MFTKARNAITYATLAYFAEVGKILTHLTGFKPQLVTDLLRGNYVHAFLLQALQEARVKNKSFNRRLCYAHSTTSLSLKLGVEGQVAVNGFTCKGQIHHSAL